MLTKTYDSAIWRFGAFNYFWFYMMNVLIIIPARGGSKGIPRKNLRSLGGKPLIAYAVATALLSDYHPDVYVSSDDDEILNIAKMLGADTHKRDACIANDTATLDPVIYDAYEHISKAKGKLYDVIVTMQPTSPLLKTITLDSALKRFEIDARLDTLISAKEDTHLTWLQNGEKYIPNYQKRVNRQYLPPVYRETGGFLITRSDVIGPENRIGKSVDLYLLGGGEEIDIDTYEDWKLCEYYIRRKKILIVVSGYPEIGLGHVYNTLLIANDILDHSIEFLVDKKSELAYEKIQAMNYSVHMQFHDNLTEDIRLIAPDVVINDCLDTEASYVDTLKGWGMKVINFEDLGSGAAKADVVINAIYPEKKAYPHHYYGYRYVLLRDEFILMTPRPPRETVERVLLTFGGVDPNNYTYKVLESIYDYCRHKGIAISIVAGMGYAFYDVLDNYEGVEIYKNASNISEHMQAADIVFTSAGRTTYEVAILNVPTIVLAQNEREMTHLFASPEHGFVHLGLGYNIDSAEILASFKKLVEDRQIRSDMSEKMAQADLRKGRKRTLSLINKVLESL